MIFNPKFLSQLDGERVDLHIKTPVSNPGSVISYRNMTMTACVGYVSFTKEMDGIGLTVRINYENIESVSVSHGPSIWAREILGRQVNDYIKTT